MGGYTLLTSSRLLSAIPRVDSTKFFGDGTTPTLTVYSTAEYSLNVFLKSMCYKIRPLDIFFPTNFTTNLHGSGLRNKTGLHLPKSGSHRHHSLTSLFQLKSSKAVLRRLCTEKKLLRSEYRNKSNNCSPAGTRKKTTLLFGMNRLL